MIVITILRIIHQQRRKHFKWTKKKKNNNLRSSSNQIKPNKTDMKPKRWRSVCTLSSASAKWPISRKTFSELDLYVKPRPTLMVAAAPNANQQHKQTKSHAQASRSFHFLPESYYQQRRFVQNSRTQCPCLLTAAGVSDRRHKQTNKKTAINL